MNLYELTQQLREALADVANDPTDEAAINYLATVAQSHDDKIRAVVAYALEIDARIKARDEAISRMLEANERDERSRQWFMEYVKDSMLAVGQKKVDFPEFGVSVRKNPRSVHIVDADAIPSEFKTVVTITKIDKKRLANDLKEGVIIDGATLTPESYHLRIT